MERVNVWSGSGVAEGAGSEIGDVGMGTATGQDFIGTSELRTGSGGAVGRGWIPLDGIHCLGSDYGAGRALAKGSHVGVETTYLKFHWSQHFGSTVIEGHGEATGFMHGGDSPGNHALEIW